MARLSGLMLKGGIDKTMLDLVRPVNSLYLTVGSEDPNTFSGDTGEGGAHENRPPYLAVDMWKRVS